MEMYSEAVLRYYELPPNKSKIPGADKHAHADNPLCGDEIAVYLKIKGGKIVKASFEGQGCAISQAAASMLLESIEGKGRRKKQGQSINVLGVKKKKKAGGLLETRQKRLFEGVGGGDTPRAPQ